VIEAFKRSGGRGRQSFGAVEPEPRHRLGRFLHRGDLQTEL